MTERKLVSIQRIAEVKTIQNADLIQAYRINGWWIVSKKDEFSVGDLVVYLEVDSFVPTELAPFLSKGKEPRQYLGIKGERLRTIKLKGQISQGLILHSDVVSCMDCDLSEGVDVTAHLGIIKWEPPAEFMSADAKGLFPSFIPKTDQERIQNLTHEFSEWKINGSMWQVTEKLDGSSLTAYVNEEESGVCSRNLDLKDDDTNTWWKLAKQYELIQKIKSTGKNLAIQGEIYGSSINGNLYSLQDQRFAMFSAFCIDTQSYLLPEATVELARSLGIPHVPVIGYKILTGTVQDALDQADGASCINPMSIREGFVYKNTKSNESFKAIGNSYLLKKG